MQPSPLLCCISLFAFAGISARADEKAAEIYSAASPSVFMISIHGPSGSPISFGTGFLIASGKLATNWHVVKSGRPFLELGAISVPVEVEAKDVAADLAIVSVNADISARPLKLATRTPAPGDGVFVIGNPEGLEKSISTGVLSGIREAKGRKLLQISAPISPGSSGGPVLNAAGEVIGITVAMLTEGQNLNFAVPTAALNQLLTPTRQGKAGDLQHLLAEAEELKAAESKLQYSADADSEYQKVHSRLLTTISTALDQPELTEASALRLAQQAEDADIQIKAAERAFSLKPSAEASFQKGVGLRLKYFVAEGDERLRLARQAADAFRSAIQLAKSPEPGAYLGLGWALEETGPPDQAEVYFIRGFESAKRKSDDAKQRKSDEGTRAECIRGLVRVKYAEKRPRDGDIWFKKLADNGQAEAYDWDLEGNRRHDLGARRDAAVNYEMAASASEVALERLVLCRPELERGRGRQSLQYKAGWRHKRTRTGRRSEVRQCRDG